jgi:DNA-binding NarL/FixJ family response regulator
VYGPEHVERLRFIRNCRALDMSHHKIHSLLGLAYQAEQGCGAVNEVFDQHIAHVDECMRELAHLKRLEAMRRLRAEPLSCKMICLSAHADPQQVAQALDAGASGYVLKESAFAELARCIRRVMANQIFLSGEQAGDLLQGRQQPASASICSTNLGPATRLTRREREMVQLFSEGYSAQEIATRLHLSAKTVATHRENAFTKLQIQGMAELTRFALREELSTLDVSRPRNPADALLVNKPSAKC